MCNLGEALYEEAKQEGIECGMEQTLVNQITAKLNKGMDITSIADMLETDEDYIKELIDKHELMSLAAMCACGHRHKATNNTEPTGDVI